MKKTVDAAEVNENTVVGDVLDETFNDRAFLKFFESCVFKSFSFFLKKISSRNDDVAFLLVEFDDFEVIGFADEVIDVFDGSQGNL